jgi:hypothetical protein
MSDFKERRELANKIMVWSLGFGGALSMMLFFTGIFAALAAIIFPICCLIGGGAFLYGYILPAFNKMNPVTKYITIGVVALMFIGYFLKSFLFSFLIFSESFKPAINDKETTIDACLAKYDFDCARKSFAELDEYEKGETLKKITIAEAKYWSQKKKDHNRALGILDESWGVDDSDWKENDWQSFRFSLLEDGIEDLCVNKKDFKAARVLALKAPEDINEEGFKIGSGTGKYLDEDGIEKDYSCMGCGWKEIKANGPAQRELLNKKIKEYEVIQQ